MKSFVLAAFFAVFTISQAAAQSGGSFAIESSTIDSGGGLSSGGTFALAGTIGQPDAGTHAGGTFALRGGFWQAFIVSMPEAPPLSLRLVSGPRALLAWPVTNGLWQLESSTDLENWAPVPGDPQEGGGLWAVTVDAGQPRLFFRLVPVP